MSKNIDKLALEIWDRIKKSKNILLHFHPGPDGDCIGSSLAFYQALKNLGKKVTLISGDSEPPKSFSSLPSFDEVINKNYFQLDLVDFDLFIVLDSASLSQISKIESVVFPKNLKTTSIDHHASNGKFADLNLIVDYSSTCQVVYELFKKWKIKITPEIAVCLLVGIYTDSGGFKYPPTDYKTFEAVSELVKIEPNFSKVIFNIENNDDPNRLKVLAIMLNSIENFLGDHVAIASLDYKTIKKKKINPNITENLNVANMLKAVTGWDIGISMIEYQPKKVKVSFRTRDPYKYDLNVIASATGTGGGHKAAAGATINKPLKYAKKFLLKIISEIHPELK